LERRTVRVALFEVFVEGLGELSDLLQQLWVGSARQLCKLRTRLRYSFAVRNSVIAEEENRGFWWLLVFKK
jgi:hypothetical protein